MTCPSGQSRPSRLRGAAASFLGATIAACAAPEPVPSPEAPTILTTSPRLSEARAHPIARAARPVPVEACDDGLPVQRVGRYLLHCPAGAPTVVDLESPWGEGATPLPGPGPWALHADAAGPVAASVAGGVWTPGGRVPPRAGDTSNAPPAVSAGSPPVLAWTDAAAAHWRATDADTTWDAPLRPAGWYPPAVARGADGPWAVWTAFTGPGGPVGEARLYAVHPDTGGDPVRFGLGGFEHHPVADGRWLAWVRDGDVVVADLAADGGPTAVVWPADAGAQTAPALADGRVCWEERGDTVVCDDGWQTEGTDPTGGGPGLLVRRGGQWIRWDSP